MNVPVIEWGTGSYRGYDPVSRSTIESSSLEELVNRMGRPKAVGLALGRRVALLKYVTLPDVQREQMALIVDLQLDQMFPVGGGEMTSDFHVIGKNGTGVKAVVVAARNEMLRTAIEELKAQGIKTIWMSPTALAAAEAGKQAGQQQAVVVELTAEGVGFDVVVDGSVVYSRSSAVPDSVEGMEQEIARTLQTAKVDHAPMVGIGGLKSDMATAMLDASSLEMLSGHEPKLVFELPEVRAARTMDRVRSRRNLGSLLLLAAVAAIALVMTDREDNKRKIDSALRTPTRVLVNRKSTSTELSKRIAETAAPLVVVNHTFNPAQTPSDVMIILSEATSVELWLTGVTLERGRPVQIRGTATTQEAVARFVQALSQNERFREVNLLFANDGKIDDTPIVLFSVTAHVMGNYPVIDKGSVKK